MFGKKGIRSSLCHSYTSSNSVCAPCKLTEVNVHKRWEKESSSSAPKLQCRMDYLNYSQLLNLAREQKKTIIKLKKKEKYLQEKRKEMITVSEESHNDLTILLKRFEGVLKE